jgi:hypothetical protein
LDLENGFVSHFGFRRRMHVLCGALVHAVRVGFDGGPWERAPSARADSSLRSSDMVLDYMVERGCTGNVVKCFVLIVKLLVTGFFGGGGFGRGWAAKRR